MARYEKPTLDTKFYIDFDWWPETGRNLRSYLESQACPEVLDLYHRAEQKTFDWVSPDTGMVYTVDLLWHLIRQHCIMQDDFITELTPITSAVFKTLLAHNNTPMSPVEIHTYTQKKTPELILRTIGGRTVYEGIRPMVWVI